MSAKIPTRGALALLLPLALLLAACGDTSDDAEDDTGDEESTSVSFTSPEDGARVAGSVKLVMAAEGLTIEPAGEVRDGAGHFHVIADDGCVEPGAAVAKDADHVHFGKGQSEGAIYLGPGEHELCLQPGDGVHVALDITDTITITVGVETRDEWCGVVKEVDDLFLAADTSEEEYAVRQGQYGSIQRLIAQLTDADDQIDASVRADVLSALEQASEIAGTVAAASDEAAADAALMDTYGSEGAQPSAAASAWILDTCGVDING